MRRELSQFNMCELPPFSNDIIRDRCDGRPPPFVWVVFNEQWDDAREYVLKPCLFVPARDYYPGRYDFGYLDKSQVRLVVETSDEYDVAHLAIDIARVAAPVYLYHDENRQEINDYFKDLILAEGNPQIYQWTNGLKKDYCFRRNVAK